MLENVLVKNVALIDETEISFQKGLNVLTGETGAGKSILLGSIALALGGAYRSDMLRTGAEFGLAELTFLVEEPRLIQQLAALGVERQDNRVVVSRKVTPGRSSCRINGEMVNLELLQETASLLIDIHGQEDNRSLLKKKNHLAFLDLYAGEKAKSLKEQTANAYEAYMSCERALLAVQMDESQRVREMDLLTFEAKEIEDAHLSVGEDLELEALYGRMSGGKRIADAIGQARQYTSEDTGANASDCLSRAIHALQQMDAPDEEGERLVEQLTEIDSLLNDFNRDLARYGDSFVYAPEELQQTEKRLNQINHLKAKYGNSVEEILAGLATRQERLEVLTDLENQRERLEEQKRQAYLRYEECALALRALRKEMASGFTEKVRQALEELHFLQVQLEMRFAETVGPTAEGMDEGELYISTNPGEPVKPLGEIASGGERSRIMLAVKSVLSDKEDVPTLIFDEIDTGISGETAVQVAEKMKSIAGNRQVICITHLPQIAGKADYHYGIQKTAYENATRTTIRLLSEEESIRALASMLGGENITESILQSARELKGL